MRRMRMLLLAVLPHGVVGQDWLRPVSLDIEDADTLIVVVDAQIYRVQLPDIDAPESRLNPKLQRDSQGTGLQVEELSLCALESEAKARRPR